MYFRTLEDLQKLIDNKIKESLKLDYKSELGENKEIAKDVSAFANTLGGTIIYGINEEDGAPVSFNWIESKGVKERIESVIMSSVQPKIEEYEIIPIQNPDDSSKAIFIANIPESLNAPHMANHRYYKRYSFQSVPMEDHEVKEAIFKKGLRKGLEFELSKNLELAKKTWELIDKIIDSYRPEQVKPTVFTPFYTDAWEAVVSSGFLYVLKEKAVELVKAYSLIHEINHLIDCQKHGLEIIVTPSYKGSLPDHGTYIPSIIKTKIQELYGMLDRLKKEIEK